MRGRQFTASNSKIETVDECVTELYKAWTQYVSSRMRYSTALYNHNRLRTNRFDVDAMETSTIEADETRTAYLNRIDELKEAHRKYKTAFRGMLTSKIF